jgi:micrococcal nuclease
MSLFPPEDLGDDLARVTSILNDAIEAGERLTDWEHQFVEGVRERVIRYGARTRISEKQMEVIERIDAKLKE